MKKTLVRGVTLFTSLFLLLGTTCKAAEYTCVELGEYGRPWYFEDSELEEEVYYDELEILAQLVHAEAGNQSFYGKCLVVDVVLNRVESDDFPDTIYEVIFQEGQFSVTTNGAFEKAAWDMQESDYAAVEAEIISLTNDEVLYFNNSKQVSGGGQPFKVGDHWFNTK